MTEPVRIVAFVAALLAAPALVVAAPDRDMQQVLDALQSLGPKPLETLSPQQARQQPTQADAVATILNKEGKAEAAKSGATTRDLTVPGPQGALPARLYTPDGTAGALPLIVYYHGGGWVIADIDTYDASARALASQAKAVVLAVHYRQGPEHRFPAAHEDAFAAYRWALDNAGTLGADPSRVAVAGESAGGNLAVNVSIMARDQNIPLPIHQVLIYPVAGSDMTTPSYQENASAKPLSKPAMQWFARNALRGDADLKDPRINLVAADLHGLPPTTLITAEIDPLRSEGQQLAANLKKAGGDVEARDYPGVTHEFFGMGAIVADARAAEAFVAERLRGAFAAPGLSGSTAKR